MMRDAAATFAQEVVAPRVKEMDAKSQMDPELIEAMFANGLMGIEVPQELDGVGANFTSACLCVEELAKVDPAVSVCMDVHNTVVNNTLAKWASDDIKQEWLPQLATQTMGSFCLSEAGSGCDAFALATTASQSEEGGDYTLNGTKMWITNAEHAGLFLVFANVNPQLEPKYKGITCFAVPKGTPGLSIGPKEDKLGIRASSTCPVILEDVKVPHSAVVGEVGQGYKYAIGILNEGRIGIGAQMVGLAQGAFEATMPYMWQRKQFGQPIGEFQAMGHQFADVACDIEAARLLVYNAARMKENGMPFVKEAAMAKLKASLVAETTASKCIEWMGGVGFMKEYPVEKFFRDCKVGQIYEGTSNIQRETIAKFIANEYK